MNELIVSITSKQNRLFKHWKKLHKRKERLKSGSMLVEGEHLFQEAITSRLSLIAVLVTKKKLSWLQSQKEWIKFESKVPIYMLPDHLFRELSDTQTPQGIATEVEIPTWSDPDVITGHTHLLIDSIQDPGNLGSLIRTAEATGVDGIWLGKGTVDPTNSKVVRSAMGSSFRLPVFLVDIKQIILQMKTIGIQVIGTSPRAENPHFSLNYPKKVAFLLGHEGKGVNPQFASLVDEKVKIPMFGNTESLNVSISAAVLLYERLRQLSVTCKSNLHQL